MAHLQHPRSGLMLLRMDNAGPLCLTYADLDHMVFLPALASLDSGRPEVLHSSWSITGLRSAGSHCERERQDGGCTGLAKQFRRDGHSPASIDSVIDEQQGAVEARLHAKPLPHACRRLGRSQGIASLQRWSVYRSFGTRRPAPGA